jgi:hypothetical protein
MNTLTTSPIIAATITSTCSRFNVNNVSKLAFIPTTIFTDFVRLRIIGLSHLQPYPATLVMIPVSAIIAPLMIPGTSFLVVETRVEEEHFGKEEEIAPKIDVKGAGHFLSPCGEKDHPEGGRYVIHVESGGVLEE